MNLWDEFILTWQAIGFHAFVDLDLYWLGRRLGIEDRR